ncbi:MAG: adenylate/guanylate cyclase domain-containing protein, partial [Pseudomonadota bacterium]
MVDDRAARSTVTPKMPAIAALIAGAHLAQRLRLATGLVLFSFALGHFINHALGLISVPVMEAAGEVRRAIWQSLPGTVLLYGSLVLHMALALAKTLRRRTWRMPATEAMQLALGLTIPVMLIDHVVGTRVLHEVFQIDDSYTAVLSVLWPGIAVWQSVLLLVVWGHAMIGLYFWLRMRSWFARAAPLLMAAAVVIPALALAGWIEASRRLVLADETERVLTREAVIWSGPVITYGRYVLIALILGAVLTSLAVSLGLFDRNRFSVTYPGGRTVRARPGQTLLEISRENGIAHTSVCGGRARCSTCRTRITDGLDQLPTVDAPERGVLKRISAGPDVRLACQLRPRSALKVQPLFPAVSAEASLADDSYRWGMEQSIAILFVDIRQFTALSERRLPFDVVFILNEYLSTMAKQVTRNQGVVDKFIGDSVMGLFGITTGPQRGARDALGIDVPIIGISKPRGDKRKGITGTTDRLVLPHEPDPVFLPEGHPG